jgi:hypothetical protein
MSESENHVVQIPSKAVADKADVRQPVRDLLEGLYLIGSPEDTEKAGDFSAAFKGPPQSVALIEAGATTATKLWAGGLSAAVAAGWVTVGAWWGDQAMAVQATVIGGAAFATAAVALAIGYLFGSDVRGRAASAVATINARAQVAVEMIQAAQEVHERPDVPAGVQFVPLPAGIRVTNTAEPAGNEANWLAVAIERRGDDKFKYLVVKGRDKKTVDDDTLVFE